MSDPVLDLCNRALVTAGGRATLTSLTDGSNEARVAGQFYPSCLVQVLSRVRWNFAQVTAAGVQQVGPNLPQAWQYAYLLPKDCVRMQTVMAQPSAGLPVPIFGPALASLQSVVSQAYAMGNSLGLRVIFANAPSVILGYTGMVQDLTQWEPQALIALEWLLAARMAVPLSGDKTLAQMLAKQTEEAIIAAAVADGNEVIQTQDVPTDWLAARSWLDPQSPWQFPLLNISGNQ